MNITMKNQTAKLLTILFLGLAVVACKKSPNKVEATEAEEVSKIQEDAARYVVDSAVVAWKGIAPTKFHIGTINVSEGYVAFDDGKLNGGNFIIDMKTIKNLDLDNPEYNAKLVGHLLSADFFDVENNPYSVFAITGVDEREGKLWVKGNLTIKKIKKNIEFPATVSTEGNSLTFTSETFTIDRTEWEVNYNSGKFTENLKDKLINDNIELSVSLHATKS